MEEVFDKAYDRLQSQIKSLMDLYIKAESLVMASASGITILKGNKSATVGESVKLLKELHEQMEIRHDIVALAVAERDKRYKKTEIQPLYAAGNISKMKNMEKNFENAEKQAIFQAKSDKAGRIGDLVKFVEEVMVSAIGVEQGEIDRIVSAIRDLTETSDEGLLTRARSTILALKSSSKSLLSQLNLLELELNDCIHEAEVAQARAENAGPERIQQLEKELFEEKKNTQGEYQRRVDVIEQDREEIDQLIEQKGGRLELDEEEEKEKRIKRALEEAKRRNGDL